ncbi:lipase maturation factor 2-like [Oscarella lobularis]|uniref:lipase maturation factor 2-like n=1 Tax=Oscarella lobularis TaxID=121494 RepID=UPI0033135142
MEQAYVRQIFLWSLGAIYLFAFLSLYVQIPGLYGTDGLLPVFRLMPFDSRFSAWDRFLQKPSLLFLIRGYMGMSAESGLDLLCLLGAALAFGTLLFETMRSSLVYLCLWWFYYSIYYFGQTFMWFQWDILLLETGFLAILVAPFSLKFWQKPSSQHHDGVMMWLVKWLLFRLMFASGIVKLTSQCPTWWSLTALDYHYETQCIPTPLAWYAHQLPGWFQKLSVVGTYFIEIAVPFLFFVPVRPLRLIAFYLQVFFQLCIILTGNYNFFNLNTIALCFSLLDDRYISKAFGWKHEEKDSVFERLFSKKLCKIASRLVTIIVLIIMLGYTVRYFNIYIDFDSKTIVSSIGFSLKGFTAALHDVMPYTVYIGLVSLGIEILKAIYRSLVRSDENVFGRIFSFVLTVFWSGVAVTMFGMSLIPFSVLDYSTKDIVWPVFHRLHDNMQGYHLSLVNSYGLFRRMTGVEGRPEIVIEGSNEVDSGWKAYEFLYKPGDPSETPPIVAPHQPRLDWQMWFAALGEYKNNPWFVNLLWRLLHNRKSVLSLLEKNPFPDKPPIFIRAKFYRYHFTGWNEETENWWRREEDKDLYMSPIAKNVSIVREYLLNSIGMHYRIPDDDAPLERDFVSVTVRAIRSYLGEAPPMPLLMSVFTTAVLLISTRKIGESVRRERKMKKESNDGNKKTEKKRR